MHGEAVIQMICRAMADPVGIGEIAHDDALTEFLRQIRLVCPRQLLEAFDHALIEHVRARLM
jgi:hypothetical protein